LAVRFALSGVLGSTVPYITLYPAVVFAIWFGGLGPGILATALSLAAVISFLIPLHRLNAPADIIRAVIFVGFAGLFNALHEGLQRARASSERDRDLLRVTLSSIGDAVIAADAQGKVTFLNTVAEELTGWSREDAAGKPVPEVFVIRDGALIGKGGREIPVEQSEAPIYDSQRQVLGAVLVFRDVTARRRAEYALKKSEERLKLALGAGQIGVWDWNIVEDRAEWSDRVYEIFGAERKKEPGGVEDFTRLVHPEDRERVKDAIREAVEWNAPYAVEFRVIHPKGNVVWISTTGQAFWNKKGEAIRMLGSITDITERKNAEALLRQQWHTFDTALSNTPDFTYIFDLNGRFTYINRALLSLLERSFEDAVGKNFFELEYPPELAGRLQDQIQQVIDTRAPVRDQTPFTAPSGETGYYEYIFVPICAPGGRVEAVAGSTRDITGLKRVEEKMRATEERLLFALEAGGGVGTWDWDVPNDRVYTDRMLATFHSVDPDRAAQGVSIQEFVKALHVDDRGRAQENIQSTLETGGDFEGEYRVVQKDGSVRWIYDRGRCHLDKNGKPTRFPGVGFEITGRKRAEEHLKRANDWLEGALNSAEVGLWTWDIAGNRIVAVGNIAFLYGMDRMELAAGLPVERFIERVYPDDVAGVEKALTDTLSQGGRYRVEHRVRSADGAVRWIASHGRIKMGEDGKPESMSGLVLDVTERQRAESKLSESEQRFSLLAECIPQMIWTAGPDGALDYVSGQTVGYFGVGPESLLGAGWLDGVHPDDRENAEERWRHCIQTGENYETAFRLRRGSDGSWRWHLARALPLVGGGEVAQWFGTCTDIEDQKAIEAELTVANSELEEFAYVASHDLQEPLRMVNIYTQLILQDLEGTRLVQYANFVQQGVQRMEGLIHDLLTFSRAVHSDGLPVGMADLSESLNEAVLMLKNRMEETGCVLTAGDLPTVRGDAPQMAHVFQNLLSNALKYRKKDVPPRIDISAEQEGNNWVISMRDNGIGFDSQYAERIFGLFKRLHKEEYPGTGLGLAICKRIVERAGGRIWAEGVRGEGATFYFSMPREQ